MKTVIVLCFFFCCFVLVTSKSWPSPSKCKAHNGKAIVCGRPNACLFKCEDGWADTKGSLTLIARCQSDGEWDQLCHPVKCGMPFEIDFAFWKEKETPDSYGCKAPADIGDEPTLCKCNEKSKDGSKVIPVPSTGVTVSCGKDENGCKSFGSMRRY